MQQEVALYTGLHGRRGAASMSWTAMLAEAGFADIRIAPKDASREFIRDWAPGRGSRGIHRFGHHRGGQAANLKENAE